MLSMQGWMENFGGAATSRQYTNLAMSLARFGDFVQAVLTGIIL